MYSNIKIMSKSKDYIYLRVCLYRIPVDCQSVEDEIYCIFLMMKLIHFKLFEECRLHRSPK